MMGTVGLSFGRMIRAARMRYGRLPLSGQEGFMRLSDGPTGGILCELHPLGLVPNDHREVEHYIWWQDAEGKIDYGIPLVRSSPFLRSLRRIKKPFAVVLGDDGMPVSGKERGAPDAEMG